MRALVLLALLAPSAPARATIHVPADKPTIREAIEAAREGDTILVAPGLYRESLVVGKAVTIASRFLQSKDPKDVEATVLDGEKKTVFTVPKGAEARIVGLTIRNGDDGVCVDGGKVEVLHCRLLGNHEGISFEGGRGVIRGCRIEGSGDDGIDCDQATDALIEENAILGNKDDGVEVRLHPYSGPRLQIVIRRNLFSGNKEDGVQLIDYPGLSDRSIRIEGNVIHASAMAGVGCMKDGNTKENYEGAPLQEPVLVIGNTFVENQVGLTGGDALTALNNLFVGTRKSALKRLRGDSIAAHTLFWKNGTDHEDAAIVKETLLFADPRLDAEHRLGDGSPAIDAGTALFERGGRRLFELPRDSWLGPAPDLGAFERR